MLSFIFAPFYLFVNLYLLHWVLRWTGCCHRVCGTRAFRALVSAVYVFAMASPLTGFLVRKPAGLHRFLMRLGNGWLGVMLYLTLAVLAVELGLVVVRRVRRGDFAEMQRVRRRQGGIALALVLAVCAYGAVNAETLRVTEREITLSGTGEEMCVALLADLHLGYNTDPAYIEETVRAVNAMQPDLIVIAGDIFDNDYAAIPDPARIEAALASLDSAYGVYACWGNHDVSEPILAGFTWDTADADKNDPRMTEMLTRAGVQLLADEKRELPNGVQLVGRRDPSRSVKLGETRRSAAEWGALLDPSRPAFVIDHQPDELDELAAAGFDLDLSGHTHDGQMFPANLIMRLLWRNSCGVVQVGEMTSAVTAGLGVWGPPLRVGTASEVMCLRVRFA